MRNVSRRRTLLVVVLATVAVLAAGAYAVRNDDRAEALQRRRSAVTSILREYVTRASTYRFRHHRYPPSGPAATVLPNALSAGRYLRPDASPVTFAPVDGGRGYVLAASRLEPDLLAEIPRADGHGPCRRACTILTLDSSGVLAGR